MEEVRRLIRDVPDFPKPGIIFKDITPLLGHPDGFRSAMDALAEPYRGKKIAKLAAIESRGFLLAAGLAERLGAGIVPIRKKGKLPYRTISVSYGLEYGTDTLELHEDAVVKDEPVLIVDDVLATGGTAKAACDLIERLGGKVFGCAFLIELGFLNGRAKLPNRTVTSLLRY
jgi:adenine phosphoribosyltransferase